MDESILNSIKKLLGITEDYNHFDQDIILHINTVLFNLNQLGVGPAEGFAISGPEETWQDFAGDVTDIESIKSYVYLKVRLLFDPPTSGSAMDSMERLANELEWRINLQVESRPKV